MPVSPTSAKPQSAEALIQQILGLSAERKSIMDEEAAQAQQNLQQAEQAPPEPGAGPIATSLATAGSRLATTLAGPGGPDYSKQLKGTMAKKSSDEGAARLANVTRLRATYEKAAERSAKMGDNDAEVKARVALKKIDEQMAKDKQSAEEAQRTAATTAANTEWMKREGVQHGNNMALEGFRQQGRKELKTGADGKYSKLDDEHVPIVGQQLVDGTLPWSKIGQGDVGKVAKWLTDSGKVVLNNKGRENTKKLDGFEQAILEIESLSRNVNTAKGSDRFSQGAKNVGEGFLRNTKRGLAVKQLEDSRKQFLALIARGYGEVGNLAEQEQVRQLEGLPDQWTDIETAKASITKAKRIIANLRKQNLKAYTEPMGGLATGGASSTGAAPAPSTGKRIKVDFDAQGNLITQ